MSVAWMAMGLGGMIGCCGGGYLTQYSHPKYTFVSIMGLIIALIGTALTKEAEQNEA
jgi:predicted MFS family arabinose efflux permease